MRRPASYLLGSAVLVLLIGALLQGVKPANALPTSITLASGVSTVTGPGTVVSGANGAYGVIPGATWITATGATGTADAFSVTFTLPAGYSNAQLTGSFFADNWATVWLNGVLINNAQPVGDVHANFGAGSAPPTPFTASAPFVTGTNTLTFQVFNGIAGNPTNTTAPPDSSNPEALDFSATVTFQTVPSEKDQCKNGGWQNLVDSEGNSFKNQGDCVSFVATKGKNLGAVAAPTP